MNGWFPFVLGALVIMISHPQVEQRKRSPCSTLFISVATAILLNFARAIVTELASGEAADLLLERSRYPEDVGVGEAPADDHHSDRQHALRVARNADSRMP